MTRNINIPFLKGVCLFSVLYKITNGSSLSGQILHIWHRKRLPSYKVVENISKDSWILFKEYLRQEFHIDPNGGFMWEFGKVHGTTTSAPGLYECIYLEEGFTVLFWGVVNQVELVYDTHSPEEKRENIFYKLSELSESIVQGFIGLLTSVNDTMNVNFFPYDQHQHDLLPHHGEEVNVFFESMIRHIKSENQSGLYLLHGEPGTGKTSFIKRVLLEVDKRAIFINPNMAVNLDSPQLIDVLANYTGAVLVIEDAEKILMKREGDFSGAVSTILNLSDGFTADFLNQTIICTFNTKITDIDPALLRKGRLTGMHEFKKLSPENANRIAEVLGLSIRVTESITLTDLCYANEESYLSDEKSIGFKGS